MFQIIGSNKIAPMLIEDDSSKAKSVSIEMNASVLNISNGNLYNETQIINNSVTQGEWTMIAALTKNSR